MEIGFLVQIFSVMVSPTSTTNELNEWYTRETTSIISPDGFTLEGGIVGTQVRVVSPTSSRGELNERYIRKMTHIFIALLWF